LDVLVVMYLTSRNFRWLEGVVVSLILLIGGCFLAQMVFARPAMGELMAGLVPSVEILRNPGMLYVAIGILGATVMPHNLYLHSSVVQTRKYDPSPEGRREAIRFATIDSTVALMSALFINAAILVVAAATFHRTGRVVEDIDQAHELLSPLLGVTAAGTLFALALLASGQNSTLTGTLSGQIVMEGFLNLRLRPWLRRLITRSLAIIPAVIVTVLYGNAGASKLLILSQVILSLQLPFAVIPLVLFTSDRRKMGEFVAPRWQRLLAWFVAAVIVVLNVKLLADTVGFTGR
jgi:manganese transport protein